MSVAAKLHQVYQNVSSITKDQSTDTGPRYNYLSEEKIVRELHKAFTEAGLVFAPVKWEMLSERIDELSSGKQSFNVRMLGTFHVIDSETGEVLEVQSVGEASDIGDKVCNKAQTCAYKYALRQTCMIATGDDPDTTASTETTASRPQSRPNGNSGPTEAQKTLLKKLMDERSFDSAGGLGAVIQETLGHRPSASEMTRQEASKLIDVLKAFPDKDGGNQ